MGLRAHKVAKDSCFIIFNEDPPEDAESPKLKESVAIKVDCLAEGGSASGGSGGEGESERSRLEAKVARGEATPEEARALLRLCAKQHDQACMKRATAALRAQPH